MGSKVGPTIAILLAAGESRRMRQLKALLPWQGSTLLEHQAAALLDIGGLTPEELAVSIMSEIIMVRRGGKGGPMGMDEWFIERAANIVQRTVEV